MYVIAMLIGVIFIVFSYDVVVIYLVEKLALAK